MSSKQALLGKIAAREAKIGIIGLGYVGLPLAVEFAEAGFCVLGLDVQAEKVRQINAGKSYIADAPAERLRPLVAAGRLRATTDHRELRAVDSISICVPTPLDAARQPDMSYIISAAQSIAEIRHPGLLVLLESTAYPGATQEIILPALAGADLTVGEDVFVAYSPERIDPGNKKYSVHNTPKVVGGVTAHCSEVASALYASSLEQVVTVSSPTVAEMVKLLENTFRAVNIGLVNEMALICDKLQIDVWEVIAAAATKPFGYMPFYPGPGVGGHCIPVDPHYLSWKLKTLDYDARFIALASEINSAMPEHVLEKITAALNRQARAVDGARIVILGVAYKRDVADARESPALEIISRLRQRGADVRYHDPHVPEIRLDGNICLRSQTYSQTLLQAAHCVVVVTDHSDFDWQEIARHSQAIVDTRNVFPADAGCHIIGL